MDITQYEQFKPSVAVKIDDQNYATTPSTKILCGVFKRFFQKNLQLLSG